VPGREVAAGHAGHDHGASDHHADDAQVSRHRTGAGHGAEQREKRLGIALVLNGVIVAVQVGFGFAAKSLGLLADAGHNLTDIAAIGASLVAVRWARRRPTVQRSFGYHRATILAALANAAGILVITVFIFFESVRRLMHPQPVRGAVVVIVALVAAVANLLGAVALRETHAGHGHGAHGQDLNMRSAMLHLLGDAAASVGVALAGAVILVSHGSYWLDPLVSMVIGLVIAMQAWKLLGSAADVLLESTPQGLAVADVAAVISAVPGVEQVHDLHIWSLSSEIRALSAHVVLDGHPSLEEAQLLGALVKEAIGGRFAIAHATLELECESCSPMGDWCAIDEVAGTQPPGEPPH
jgi:cobalt-zinc-cadmium efflux system protein